MTVTLLLHMFRTNNRVLFERPRTVQYLVWSPHGCPAFLSASASDRTKELPDGIFPSPNTTSIPRCCCHCCWFCWSLRISPHRRLAQACAPPLPVPFFHHRRRRHAFPSAASAGVPSPVPGESGGRQLRRFFLGLGPFPRLLDGGRDYRSKGTAWQAVRVPDLGQEQVRESV